MNFEAFLIKDLASNPPLAKQKDLRAKRSAHARALTQQRSDIVRAGIRGAIPAQLRVHALHHRGLATYVRKRITKFRPATFGLVRVPDLTALVFAAIDGTAPARARSTAARAVTAPAASSAEPAR